MARSILGVDIRNEAVAAVLIKQGVRKTMLVAEKYVMLSETGEPDEALGVALADVTSEVSQTGASCVVGIPARFMSYRNLRLPFSETAKIRQILPFEMESMIPFAADEVIVDFQMIGKQSENGGVEVLAAAVRKKTLAYYLASMATVGLDPDSVTVSGWSTAKILAECPSAPDNLLILDLDAGGYTMFLSISGTIRFILPAALDPPLDPKSVATGVRRSLAVIEDNRGRQAMPQAVWIVGSGGAYDDGFVDQLRRDLELPVKNGVLPSDVVGSELTVKEELTHACSLPLFFTKSESKYDFRIGEFSKKRFWAENKKNLILTCVLVILAIVTAFSNIAVQIYQKRQQAQQLEERIYSIFKKTLPEVTRIVEPIHQMQLYLDEARKQQAQFAELGSSRKVIEVLNAISRAMPTTVDIRLARFEIGPDSAFLNGTAKSFNGVNDIKNRFESLHLFKRVVIQSTAKEKKGDRVQFKMKLDLSKV